jgi:hypothetical protein
MFTASRSCHFFSPVPAEGQKFPALLPAQVCIPPVYELSRFYLQIMTVEKNIAFARLENASRSANGKDTSPQEMNALSALRLLVRHHAKETFPLGLISSPCPFSLTTINTLSLKCFHCELLPSPWQVFSFWFCNRRQSTKFHVRRTLILLFIFYFSSFSPFLSFSFSSSYFPSPKSHFLIHLFRLLPPIILISFQLLFLLLLLRGHYRPARPLIASIVQVSSVLSCSDERQNSLDEEWNRCQGLCHQRTT